MRPPLLAVLLILISFHGICQSAQGLRFIQNKGQWNSNIDFHARIPGGSLGVSARGFSVLLLDMEQLDHHHMEGHHSVNEASLQPAGEPVNGHYFRIDLLGSNLDSKPAAGAALDGHYNYFVGNDSSRWAAKALSYATILYPNVYDGIDFRVSSSGNNLKYDFIVRPGADPSQIRIEYSGVDGINITNGELEIQTIFGSLAELKPFSYQSYGEKKQGVTSEYRLDGNVVSFSFPDGYDNLRTLVIDPLLIFSTYSGSTADNWGSTATPGEHGTLYSAGVTRQELGGNFPATVGAFQTTNRGSFDMAIIKYDSAGTRFLHATLLGGANNDSPQSLVVDAASGDLLVLGISSSTDYPTSAGAFDGSFNSGTLIFNRVLNTEDEWDLVVTRFSPDGASLVGSTYLGGSGNDGLNLPKQSGGPLVANYGDEMRGDVITDESGYIYISSVTASNDFPVLDGFDSTFNAGNTDGVVIKLAPDLSSVVWSTYLGGSGFDAAYSIKFDGDKNIVLAGGTTSANFPVTPGAYQTVFKGIVDGWIARLSADGNAIMHATFTGTISFDQVYFVDLNSAGNVFCYGQTAGQMPVTAGVYNNPNTGQFLQKFSADLSTLEFSTVFGAASGSGLIIPNISPTAFLVNDCNNIYMAGWGGFVNSSSQTGFWQSSTHGMPVTSDAHQNTTSGSDFYFMVLNGDATQLVYSTYLGGNSSKTHVDGGTSRFDKYGIVYHAVCSGCAFGNSTGESTSDFPTTPNAKSRINPSLNCNNAAFKFDLSSLSAMFQTNSVDLTMPGFNNVCYPDTIVFENLSTGGKTIAWDFDDGTMVTQSNMDPRSVMHQYQQAGEYHVKLKITDLSTCSQTDSASLVVRYFKHNIVVADDTVLCEAANVELLASGGVAYNWTSDDGTFFSSDESPIVEPDSATSYFVTVTDINGCSKTDTIDVTVVYDVRASFETYDVDFSKPGYNDICWPEPVRFKNLSVHGESFIWSFDDGTIATQTKADTVSLIHGFETQGTYNVKLKAINPNTCNKVDSVTKPVTYFREQIEVGHDREICEGTTSQLSASGATSYAWVADDGSFVSSSPAPVVQPGTTTRYFLTATDEHGCVREDTIQVTVLEEVELQWQHAFNGNCSDRPSVFVQNLTPPEDEVTFHFDFGDGVTSQETEVEHIYEQDGTYALTLIAQRKFCSFAESVQLPVYRLLIPNVFTPEGSPGINDRFEVVFGTDMVPPADIGLQVQLLVLDRWGKTVFESLDYQNNWRADDLASGVYFVHLKVGSFAACKNWLHIVK